MTDGPVLVVGGTGMLGGQVATELLKRGKQVRALLRAMEGVDAVITSAAGYTRHRKGDTPQTDTVGNTNLVEAASRSGVRRFVLQHPHLRPDPEGSALLA